MLVMAQAITQAAIDAMKTAVKAMTEAAGPIENRMGAATAANACTKTNGPSLKYPFSVGQ